MANVTGPVSSTDTAIARWNGTSGTVIQDSGVTIDGSNNIAGLNSISSDGGDFTSDGSGNVTLASLTGSPTTTTQSSGDNSTKIATTAYVDSGLAGLALGSLSDCITDYSNTNMFLGQGSGAAGTSGDENTCLGIDVLAAATSGGANTAVGFYALKNSINGTGNTAIGSEAAIGLTSGQNNVVIGADTFSSATSASGTVCIGFQAGDSLTIGTDNVVIGYGADIASGASNSIAIGCDAVASSANTVQIGNSSVTSVYLGGSGATLGTSLALAGNATTTTQYSGDN